MKGDPISYRKPLSDLPIEGHVTKKGERKEVACDSRRDLSMLQIARRAFLFEKSEHYLILNK